MTPEEQNAEILRRLALGETLRKICQSSSKLCAAPTFLDRVRDDKELAEHYARARAIGCDLIADEIVEVAREEPNMVERRVDPGEVNHRRLKIDALKWTLAKQQPKKYGDKLELSGDPNAPLAPLSDVERAAKIQAILDAARARKAESEGASTGDTGNV